MISKNKIKLIHSLDTKKGRKSERLFIAEGPKVVCDILNISQADSVFATREWLDSNRFTNAKEIIEVTDDELLKISMLQHPQQIVALFEIREKEYDIAAIGSRLCIALDGVQDPGNLGTIIRIADWFGITDIFCSRDTADIYNPKVVQATMGSIARVSVCYTELDSLIEQLPDGTPIYGTLLDGDNIYEQPLTRNGLIIMGNEGNGISPAIRSKVNRRLLIPSYPPDRPTAESLNVAVATALVCSEFRRRV